MEQQTRILVVEDYEDTQKLLTHILKKAGYAVSIANNGMEGVDLFELMQKSTTPFDLVLIDFFMPIMDGLNATRIMRENGATIPIIMLTANSNVQDQTAAIAAGCSELMMKPFQKKVLLERIEYWLKSGIKFIVKR